MASGDVCLVDASVAAKWFLPETHSEAARAWLEGDRFLLAPEFMLIELANVLWKKVRVEDVTAREARNVMRAIRSFPLDVQSAAPYIESALELATALERSVYDSLYLAVAVAANGRLVTADRRLYNSLADGPFGAHVAWVEDAT